ncbi:hypothetical protein KEJ33_06260, partial [Candidatus Bathyarchaeota archaeon]|nr:hypothetical protein [Candidatus Bathyarchaeota archaeon]
MDNIARIPNIIRKNAEIIPAPLMSAKAPIRTTEIINIINIVRYVKPSLSASPGLGLIIARAISIKYLLPRIRGHIE